jgi:L-alanine-DL-glutamate epimerase-like enolase superfamily enzyme
LVRRHIRLSRLRLAYSNGLILHTARSGAVPVLDELRLTVLEDGALVALGATRVNIAYLSRIEPEALVALCRMALCAIDWRRPWSAIVQALDESLPDLPAPARMLVEMAAADGAAREAGQPLAAWLGGKPAARVDTNQTLFQSDDATMLSRAEAYVRRGFTDLKLRVGLGEFATDLSRLRLLRARFGDAITLSVDVNGAWTPEAAATQIDALLPFGLRYVEQPLPPAAWDALLALSRQAPMPIMLDESLDGPAAVERLIACRAPVLAHLKLAKLGGLDRLMAAGRRLQAAGVGVMVGQMNEGVPSTLAAAHAAVALEAPYAELYGADGLADDPAGVLTYAEGALILPSGIGLGIGLGGGLGPLTAASPEAVLWEQHR